MAAVTVTTQRTNVDGAYREKYYVINIASSGDTLDTKMKLIREVGSNDTAISKIAASGGTLTFTTSGAVTAAIVNVVGL